jgi:putative peptidoglycan lipid II flippase
LTDGSTSEISNRSLWGVAAQLVPATLGVQALSLVSSIALAHKLGATDGTDAYFLALSIPVVVYAILLAGIRLGAIPSLTTLARERPADVSRAASEIVSSVFAAALALSLVAQLLALIALPAVIGGSAHLHHVARLMIVELVPYGVTGALAGVFGAILAVRGRFALAVLVMGIEPVVKTLLVVTTSHALGAQSQVIGNIAGSALAVLVLWRSVERQGVRVRPVMVLRTRVVRDVLKVSLPLVIAQTVLQVNPLIDRATASGISHGSVTVLELGLRLYAAPMLLLSGCLLAPLAATWSARLAEHGFEAVQASCIRAIKTLTLVLPPVLVVGVVLRHQIVGVVYSGGAYSHSAVAGTASVMGMLLLALPAQVLIMALATLFVIHRDTVFPMKIAIANVVLNLGLDVALRGPMGVAGIALSTTLTVTLLGAAYVWGSRRRWGDLGLRRLRRPAALAGLSAAVTGTALVMLTRAVPASTGRLAALGVIAGAALLAMSLHVVILSIGREPLTGMLPVRFGRPAISPVPRG